MSKQEDNKKCYQRSLEFNTTRGCPNEDLKENQEEENDVCEINTELERYLDNLKTRRDSIFLARKRLSSELKQDSENTETEKEVVFPLNTGEYNNQKSCSTTQMKTEDLKQMSEKRLAEGNVRQHGDVIELDEDLQDSFGKLFESQVETLQLSDVTIEKVVKKTK